MLLLALLIAFNSTAINMDERARENATMFAFGLPAGRVLLVSVVESLLIGVLGTIVGVVAGRLLLEWLLRVLLPSTLPDIGMVIAPVRVDPGDRASSSASWPWPWPRC